MKSNFNDIFKNMFRPFGKLHRQNFMIMIGIQLIILFFCLQIFHSSVIPSPTNVFSSLITLLSSSDFYENFLDSLFFTIKGMGISIIITMIVVYLSTIPFFSLLALFISKCRYLTLTGLAFLFTMLTNNVGQLKMLLLTFGIIPYFVTSFYSTIISIPQQEIDKSFINRRNAWETLYEVIIKGKLDILFEVMRQNFAIAWMMITTVEAYDMSQGGLGVMMLKSNRHLDLATVFAMLFVVLMTGILFDWGLGKLRLIFFEYLKK